MEKKRYNAPQVLSVQTVMFETTVSSVCKKFRDKGQVPPGIEKLCRKYGK